MGCNVLHARCVTQGVRCDVRGAMRGGAMCGMRCEGPMRGIDLYEVRCVGCDVLDAICVCVCDTRCVMRCVGCDAMDAMHGIRCM